jgi:uncharacterized membrane protein YesL
MPASKDSAGAVSRPHDSPRPALRAAWRVVRAALGDTWSDLFNTAVINLLWLILTLLVVTAPPATLALFYVTNQIARGESTDPRDFVQAFGRYIAVGWRWGILQLVVIGVLVGDVLLTGRLGGDTAFGQLTQGLYVAALAFWLLLQLYALPFLFEQEELSVRTALRNGAVMIGNNMGFSAALGLLLLILLCIGAILFFLSLAGGAVFLALLGNHAVLNRLAARGSALEGKGA